LDPRGLTDNLSVLEKGAWFFGLKHDFSDSILGFECLVIHSFSMVSCVFVDGHYQTFIEAENSIGHASIVFRLRLLKHFPLIIQFSSKGYFLYFFAC
jgi:hypothetical protein